MISLHDLSMAFGAQLLFENVNATFQPGRRYGLTGPNGAGKTTLVRIISKEVEPTKGRVQTPRRLSVLKQDHSLWNEHKVIDTVIAGNLALFEALQKKEEILAVGDDMTDEQGMELAECEATIAEEDGYAAESEAATLLSGLGIPKELQSAPMRLLDTGLKVRALLAQALFGSPDGMVLDEPTNHLDLLSIRWLEGFLKQYNGTLVVISHDRHFLNEVCTNIADIDYGTIITYPGNYDDMVQAKAECRSQVEKQQQERNKKVEMLQEFVSRFKAGSRARQTRSREKEIRKLQMIQVKRSNIQRPFIKFEQERPSGKLTLEIKGITKGFGGRPVFENYTTTVQRGEKIAVIGINGAGKSTLLKSIVADYELDNGELEWGYAAKIGYYPQEHRAAIETGVTVYEWLQKSGNELPPEKIRSLMGRMLFKKDEGNKLTDKLSGGEAARLLMTRLMLQEPNVLVLDEPNNHLDLEAISALRDSLIDYEGTAIFVTHDQDLIDAVATRIIHIHEGEIEDFPGSYEDFIAKTGLGSELQRDDDEDDDVRVYTFA